MKEHELRKRIKREKIQEQMPESTRKRMDDLLDGLPEETKRSKIHRIWKNAVVFVAVLSLSTVTVFAGAKLITLGTGKLDTKHGSRQYQRSVKLNEIQKNNAKAGISRTDQGITLRIDNVGLDEGNLLLYYTVSLNKTTTAEKLEKVKKDSLQERWNLNSIWLGPQISIDGKANDEVNETRVTEAYRINNYKIKGVYRFNLTGTLKKKVKLDIKTNYLWDTKGDWSMQFTVDRSKVAKKAKVITRSKKSIVDRVIISPLGNTLRSNDKKHDLVIRDNKGRYLYYEEKNHSENSKDIYQFFKHKDTRSLEIIPVKEQSVVTKNGKVQKAVLNLKKNEIVKVSDHTRLKVADVKKQKHNLRIYFKVLDYDGAILTDGLEGRFIVDKKGRSLIKDGRSIDTWTDYEKEQLVLEFYNASKGVDYTKAAKINFLKQKAVLNEKQKQKIEIK